MCIFFLLKRPLSKQAVVLFEYNTTFVLLKWNRKILMVKVLSTIQFPNVKFAHNFHLNHYKHLLDKFWKWYYNVLTIYQSNWKEFCNKGFRANKIYLSNVNNVWTDFCLGSIEEKNHVEFNFICMSGSLLGNDLHCIIYSWDRFNENTNRLNMFIIRYLSENQIKTNITIILGRFFNYFRKKSQADFLHVRWFPKELFATHPTIIWLNQIVRCLFCMWAELACVGREGVGQFGWTPTMNGAGLNPQQTPTQSSRQEN